MINETASFHKKQQKTAIKFLAQPINIKSYTIKTIKNLLSNKPEAKENCGKKKISLVIKKKTINKIENEEN